MKYYLLLKTHFFAVLLTTVFLTSCGQVDFYERRTTLKDMKWNQDKPVRDSLLISDTSAYYNLYLCLRHTDAYNYNNIWLDLFLHTQTDTLINGKWELMLGSDAEGWEGVGLNDIWDVRQKINNAPVRFRQKGPYYYKISQCMRENPISSVMSMGLRIEKVSH